MSHYSYYSKEILGKFAKFKAWDLNGQLNHQSIIDQAFMSASMPFVTEHIALMPDCHIGMGSTIGSVIPLSGALMPAAVGVDIGCGMRALRTPHKISEVPPDRWAELRKEIEQIVPHGRTEPIEEDRGTWPEDKVPWNTQIQYRTTYFKNNIELSTLHKHMTLDEGWKYLRIIHPKSLGKYVPYPTRHLGTLGSGNHFLEFCIDQEDWVWIVVHSGSRGTGNAIGRYFTNLALEECNKWFVDLPHRDLAYLPVDSKYGQHYIFAMRWAQAYAKLNRELMINAAFKYFRHAFPTSSEETIPDGHMTEIDCHHNYMDMEHHFGRNMWIVRKGAVRARKLDLGIIPGSMGERTFIVRGKQCNEAFHSCSHGAGRAMSRTVARKSISLREHLDATEGVECIKDLSVIDESPKAYKNIDKVMEAQKELVEPVNVLKQFICIKGTNK